MRPGRVIAFASHADLTYPSGGVRLSVVQVSRDRELSRLRAKVLVAAGYLVLSVTPEESIAECDAAGANRIWVFCHTVEFYELVLIAASVRKVRPADRLVRMTGLEDTCQAPGLFDESLDPITGVEGLLRAVAELSTL